MLVLEREGDGRIMDLVRIHHKCVGGPILFQGFCLAVPKSYMSLRKQRSLVRWRNPSIGGVETNAQERIGVWTRIRDVFKEAAQRESNRRLAVLGRSHDGSELSIGFGPFCATRTMELAP